MSPDEAKVIAEIVASADGYCSVCARAGCLKLMKHFPEHDWKSMFEPIGRKYSYWANEVSQWSLDSDW